MLKITLLGTAALMPLPQRALTAVTLSCAGRTILFDCGEGTQTAARRACVSLMKADIIALTHCHGDHIFGLPGLLQTMNMLGRSEPLIIITPCGTERELAPIFELVRGLNFPLMLTELPDVGVRLCELASGWPVEARLCAFPTEHRVPSQGYCFTLSRAGRFNPERAMALGVPLQQWGILQSGEAVWVDGVQILPEQVLGKPRRGLKFAFTGDTAPCQSIVRAAADADLLISESTYGDTDHTEPANARGHMTFAQAAQLASQAHVKRLWLAHFSQMLEDPNEFLPNARAYFPDAICGEDGMSITLNFEE